MWKPNGTGANCSLPISKNKTLNMVCKKYSELTPLAKIMYIGELIHACQTDEEFFNAGEELIDIAKRKGMFDRVTIMPKSTPDEDKNSDV